MFPRAVEIVFVLLAGAFAAWQLARTIRVWLRLRGDRLVTCPANGDPAAVRVNLSDAAFRTLTFSSPKGRIADCSLWATCGTCDQACGRVAAAQESAVRNVVGDWYEKKRCVYCGKLIGAAQSFGHRAALRGPRGTTREWSEVPAASLLQSLRTDLPVCWNCHMAETFRRQHPDMVTDRPWPRNHDRRAG